MSERVASAIIVDDQGRIFVHRRSKTRRLFPGCWDFAGGHVEQSETFEDTLRREVWEETGWKLAKILAELSPKTWSENDQPRLERQYIVRVENSSLGPRLEEGKADDFRWMGRSEVELLKENRDADDNFIYESVLEAFEVIGSLHPNIS